MRLTDRAIGAAAQHNPRRGTGVGRILDDDDPVDDHRRARAACRPMVTSYAPPVRGA